MLQTENKTGNAFVSVQLYRVVVHRLTEQSSPRSRIIQDSFGLWILGTGFQIACQ